MRGEERLREARDTLRRWFEGAESPGADAYDVDIDSPGDPPAPSPFPNIERALFPDDEEVKEDPCRPLVHGASDIDFDEHGDAVEFGRVSDESAAGYEV